MWDFDTLGLARELLGHSERVSAVSWTRSSRRLLSSSADHTLIEWDILAGTATRRVAFSHPVTLSMVHPRKREMFLACVATGANGGAVYLQTWHATRALLSGTEAAPKDADADGSVAADAPSARRADASPVASFVGAGERIVVGSSKGEVTLLALDGTTLGQLHLPGGAPVKGLTMSRDAKWFCVNSVERSGGIVRAFPLERLEGKADDAKAGGRELQDVINRVQASLLQVFCKSFARLLHVFCTSFARLLQAFCKSFASLSFSLSLTHSSLSAPICHGPIFIVSYTHRRDCLYFVCSGRTRPFLQTRST